MAVIPLSAAVEGIADEAALRRLADHSGVELGAVYVTGGKQQLDRRLSGFNFAARRSPWLVLRDLDIDADCAPSLIRNLVPNRSALLGLRIPVRSLEAWLLADRENLAAFLRLSVDRVAVQPEAIERPKLELVSLARRSRRRTIRRDMVPAEGVSAKVGPGYNAHLIEFISRHWRPEEAARRSASLTGCLRALRRLGGFGS